MKEDWIGGAYSIYGRDEKLVGPPTGFWSKILKVSDQLRDISVNNIKMGVVEIRPINWIQVAQDRDRWHTLVNTAVKLRVP
jgi:hypothetical protein